MLSSMTTENDKTAYCYNQAEALRVREVRGNQAGWNTFETTGYTDLWNCARLADTEKTACCRKRFDRGLKEE